MVLPSGVLSHITVKFKLFTRYRKQFVLVFEAIIVVFVSFAVYAFSRKCGHEFTSSAEVMRRVAPAHEILKAHAFKA